MLLFCTNRSSLQENNQRADDFIVGWTRLDCTNIPPYSIRSALRRKTHSLSQFWGNQIQSHRGPLRQNNTCIAFFGQTKLSPNFPSHPSCCSPFFLEVPFVPKSPRRSQRSTKRKDTNNPVSTLLTSLYLAVPVPTRSSISEEGNLAVDHTIGELASGSVISMRDARFVAFNVMHHARPARQRPYARKMAASTKLATHVLRQASDGRLLRDPKSQLHVPDARSVSCTGTSERAFAMLVSLYWIFMR